MSSMLWPDGIPSRLASDETYTISYSVRPIASELYSSNIAFRVCFWFMHLASISAADLHNSKFKSYLWVREK